MSVGIYHILFLIRIELFFIELLTMEIASTMTKKKKNSNNWVEQKILAIISTFLQMGGFHHNLIDANPSYNN